MLSTLKNVVSWQTRALQFSAASSFPFPLLNIMYILKIHTEAPIDMQVLLHQHFWRKAIYGGKKIIKVLFFSDLFIYCSLSNDSYLVCTILRLVYGGNLLFLLLKTTSHHNYSISMLNFRYDEFVLKQISTFPHLKAFFFLENVASLEVTNHFINSLNSLEFDIKPFTVYVVFYFFEISMERSGRILKS